MRCHIALLTMYVVGLFLLLMVCHVTVWSNAGTFVSSRSGATTSRTGIYVCVVLIHYNMFCVAEVLAVL